jgi:hypothetical protein
MVRNDTVQWKAIEALGKLGPSYESITMIGAQLEENKSNKAFVEHCKQAFRRMYISDV